MCLFYLSSLFLNEFTNSLILWTFIKEAYRYFTVINNCLLSLILSNEFLIDTCHIRYIKDKKTLLFFAYRSSWMLVMFSVTVLLIFWAHEILPTFWRNFRRNFRQYFGKISSPPLPPKKRNVRNWIYCAVKILHFSRNFDNTIGNCEFRGLKLF